MIRILPLLLVILFVFFVITQVVVPLLQGTPYFPFLRKPRKTVKHEIEELRAKIEDEALIAERDTLKLNLEQLQKQKTEFPTVTEKE